MTAAQQLEITPSRMEFQRAWNRSRSRKSSSYHFKEKPSHTELIRLSLKEYRMTTRMGTYIRASTTPR